MDRIGEPVGRQRRRRGAALTPAALIVATVLLVVADQAYEHAGDSLVPGGLLDETAHVLTMLLVLWALAPRASVRRVFLPALAASVAIDADHIPGYLGSDWLTAGTSRPYTHSLLVVAIILTVALPAGRRRVVVLAVALGVAVHLWRDLSETGSGVALLWPWSDRAFALSHSSYLVAMAVVVLIDAVRCGAAPVRPPDRQRIERPRLRRRRTDLRRSS
jgi:inner membrane protein